MSQTHQSVQSQDRKNTDLYPVLHRTGVKVIGNKSIELWQWVLYIKCLLVERKCLLFYVESILSLTDHIRRSWQKIIVNVAVTSRRQMLYCICAADELAH